MSQSCAYVRQYYGVPAAIGRRVTVYGRSGIIAADRGQYIGVNFDDAKPWVIDNAHPTAEVVYGDMAELRKLTRSQQRYQRYLDVADCFESFRHYLKYEASQNRGENNGR
jgi:hypothetical protein